MSLYRYKVLLADGTEKTSKTTAKTKEAAQARVAKMNAVKEWIWIKEENSPAPETPPATLTATPKPAPAAKPSAAKVSKLDKLLYLQNSRCFFCGRVLSKTEASVEHLLPKSRGGPDADGNLVACCVSLNRTFGSMELKEKVRFILSQQGEFRCP